MTYQTPNDPSDIREPGSVATTGVPASGRPGGPSGSAPTERVQAATGEAKQQGKEVVGEATQQAREVANEARDQARAVISQAQSEVRDQAQAQTQRAASGLRTLSQQLEALRQGRVDEAGPLMDYVGQAQTKVNEFAQRLDNRGLDGVLSDVSRFARRRPGAFLLACAGAGFALARMVKSQGGSSSNGDSYSGSTWNPSRQMAPLTSQTELGMDPYGRPITSQWEGGR